MTGRQARSVRGPNAGTGEGAWGAWDVSVWYEKRPALDHVSLGPKPGEVTVVVGGDGAGKSTLLRCLAGALAPGAGQVRGPGAMRVGYLPAGSGTYPDLTVGENLAFRAAAYGLTSAVAAERAAAYLDRAGLTAARGKLAGQLSGGMRQKLGVIGAMLHGPALLVLDEPTTGVDPVSRSDLWWLIARAAAGGAAVVLATSYLDEAQRAAAVLFLDGGRVLAAGTPEQIVAAVPGSLRATAVRPPGAAGDRAWRRDGRWRVWDPSALASQPARPSGAGRGSGMGSGAQGGEGISPDLQDAVTIAALVGESRSTTTVPSPEPVAAGAVSGDPVATGEVAAELGMTATVPGEPVAAGGVAGEPVAAGGVSGEPVTAAAVSGDPVAAGALMADRSTPGPIRAESVAAGEVSARPAGASASRPAGPLARCTSVSRKFGALTAVRAVNLRVDPGEIVGLLGANGAGKTTLIRLLLGLLATSGGQVTLFGESPSRRTRRRIGYVPQGLGLYDDLTVGENLEFSAAVFGSGPAELPESLLPYAGTLVGALPRGVERRVAFAQALSHRPDLLVLDEPTSGVDPLGRARLWDTVRTAADGGAGVLVTTHYMEEAQECDRLVIMTDGAVVAEGTARQIVGAARVTVVEAVSWATAFRRLEESGLAVALAGRTLRVPGSQRETVLRALRDTDARVYAAPATLEERFFELTLPRSAASASA